MKALNIALAVLWVIAFFHAAAHDNVNATVIFMLLACAANIFVEAITEASGHEALSELVWRIAQASVNSGLLIAATASLGDTTSCQLFS